MTAWHWVGLAVMVVVLFGMGQNVRRQIQQRGCVHHGRHTGESWLKSELVDHGMRTLWRCRECGQTWST